MIAMLSTQQNPYFNIALEQYILYRWDEEVLLLYRNSCAVFIGKHQNAFAEANQAFLAENRIPLIRRISGGGTVFHDPGNINISLIRHSKLDMAAFLNPIVTAINKLGVNAHTNTKNDILIQEKKITGTAAHIFKEKSLHHGTILFDASQELLHKTLRGKKECFVDNGVKSRPSPTANLKDYLKKDISTDDFIQHLQKELFGHWNITKTVELSSSDKENIQSLITERFSTWEWNYAYSPAFIFRNSNDKIKIEISVRNGLIENTQFEIKGKTIETDYLNLIPFKTDSILEPAKKIIQNLDAEISESSLFGLFSF